MNYLKKLISLFLDEKSRFVFLATRGKYHNIPDKEYLIKMYKIMTGRELNLSNPQTYNEKLQWLKLYNRNPKYTMLVDKYRVREYVKDLIGEEFLIPLLGVWDSPDEIDFTQLPQKFVLKCNHNSGLGMCICTDKDKLNIKKVKKGLAKGLRQNYYLYGREWPYKNVSRKIIAEQFMENGTEQEGLNDYKFYCFDGKVQFIMINSDRFKNCPTKGDYFNRNFEHLDIIWGFENAPIPPKKPEKFEEMCVIAEKLSAGMPHVRIDLYVSKNKIYFGEITFFDGSGFDEITPEKWNYIIGDMIKLPEKKENF